MMLPRRDLHQQRHRVPSSLARLSLPRKTTLHRACRAWWSGVGRGGWLQCRNVLRTSFAKMVLVCISMFSSAFSAALRLYMILCVRFTSNGSGAPEDGRKCKYFHTVFSVSKHPSKSVCGRAFPAASLTLHRSYGFVFHRIVIALHAQHHIVW